MRKLVSPSVSVNESASVGQSKTHESAIRQITGSARYVDDVPAPMGIKHAAVGLSQVAKGQIQSIDLSKVSASQGVIDVITIDDVPGHTDIAPVFDGDPVLANKEILFDGQPIFAVLAESVHLARVAAKKAVIEVVEASPTLSVKQAKANDSFVRPKHTMLTGKPDSVMGGKSNIIEGHLSIGGQEHFYLEGQVSMAVPEEEDRLLIYTSSQHPSEVQKLVAEVMGVPLNKVTVDMRRMGGGFGGKETQAAQWACICALLASRNQCAVKLRLPRMQDMIATGKRHPFENSFQLAYSDNGRIEAAKIEVNGNCGHSADLSDAIVDRAMFHADNAYFIEHCLIEGHRCKTNMVSHTAFRGFGGPQGMIMAEAMMDAIARKTGQDPLTVRKSNLYDDVDRNTTPYGMAIEQNVLPDLISKLESSSDYWQRRKAISAFNQSNPILKKGLALTPVKFGISFTAKHLNQAGALVHVYTDGSIQVNHGGTEMGQGLHTKIAQIAAHEFGVEMDHIEVTSTRTDKVPNTSPTAASSGTDINGKAVQNACITIKERLAAFFADKHGGDALEVVFLNGKLSLGAKQEDFVSVVQEAYFNRISLSSSGFYKTPKIHYDRDTGKGRPFFYFANGAAVSEVTIDTLTGEYKVNRVDILHDVGASLNPAIDIGQIEGGFIQGMGWLTTEEVVWNEKGNLLSNNPATYKIPAIGDTPPDFRVELYDAANPEDSIYHSKAVGEPPFMLAISVWCALKDAISSLTDYKVDPYLPAPATPEKVLQAVLKTQQQRGCQ